MLLAIAATLSVAWIATAGDSLTGDPVVDFLLKSGPFAVVVALVTVDRLGNNSERNYLRVENAKLQKEKNDIFDFMTKEWVPSQNNLTAAVKDLLHEVSQEGQRRPIRKGG